MSGKVTLKDLKLRPEAIDLSDQPFNIVSAKVGMLDLNIPYSKIFTDPSVITIQDVTVNLEFQDPDTIKISREREFKNLKRDLLNFVKTQFKASLGKAGGSSGVTNFWFFKKAIERIFENLQINLSNFSIRLKDTTSKNPFELRVGFSKLNLISTDSKFRTAEQMGHSVAHNNESMVVYKKLEFGNFHIALTNTDENTTSRDIMDQCLFRYSFDAYIKIRLSPKPDQPQYEVSLSISTNEIRLAKAQLTKLIKISSALTTFTQKVELEREKFSMKPERSINEINQLVKQLKNSAGEPLSNEKTIRNLKKIWVNRWWKYAILAGLKRRQKKKFENNQSAFSKVMDQTQISKMFQRKIPDLALSVYQEAVNRYVDLLVEHQFDAKILEKNEDLLMEIIDLRTLLFSLSQDEIKTMAKKRIRELIPEYRRKNEGWFGWAKSMIPFIGGSEESQAEQEIRQLVQSEVGTERNGKFNKYMLDVDIKIDVFVAKFVGGSKYKPMVFSIKTHNIGIRYQKYAQSQSAKVYLQGFNFTFSKDINGKNIDFSLIKSTVPTGGKFLALDFMGYADKKESETNLDIKIDHIDIIYIEELVIDLKGFFAIQTEQNTTNEAYDKFSEARERTNVS